MVDPQITISFFTEGHDRILFLSSQINLVDISLGEESPFGDMVFAFILKEQNVSADSQALGT